MGEILKELSNFQIIHTEPVSARKITLGL